jgi:amino acid transporter
MSDSSAVPTLRGDIGRFQLFAFGFGSIIGSAWCVLVGSWLGAAGPGGAVLGFLAGGLVIACIGACYAELTSRIPVTGGEFSFVLHVFGRRPAFYVGWFIALAWICVAVFEGLAIAWLFERLAPGIGDAALYTVLGSTVTRNQLLIGGMGAPLIALLNYRGGQSLARFHSLITYAFISVALVLVALMFSQGAAANLEPLLPARQPVWWQGAAAIFANCAFLLCGFQAISQVVEERSAHVSFKTLFRILVLAVAAATGFYCLVVLATGIVSPWLSIRAGSLAFVEAVRILPGGQILAPVVLVTAMLSLVKTWNGVFLMATRTLIALTRDGFLPPWLNRWHGRSGVPGPIVLVILTINLAGLVLGRGAIGLLVDTITISLVFGYALCCLALAKLRVTDPLPQGTVRVSHSVLFAGVAGSLFMAGAAILMPPILAGGFPPVYWIFPVWAFMGLITLRLVHN